MHAVFVTGGKQYRAKEGDVLRVEKLDVSAGGNVEFDKVLLVSDGDTVKVGTQYVDGGKVSATVESQGRHNKITIIKFRRRKHHQKEQGHRQHYTEIEITGISG